MKRAIRKAAFVAILISSTLVAGCSANVGVGLNVGVPIGDHGYMSFGTGSSRWY